VTGAKRCPGCGKVKSLDEFHVDRYRADGHTARCKSCNNAASAVWRRRGEAPTPRPTFPLLRDHEALKQLHLREYLAPREIAARAGCSEATAWKALRRAGITIIPKGPRDTLRARRARETEGDVCI